MSKAIEYNMTATQKTWGEMTAARSMQLLFSLMLVLATSGCMTTRNFESLPTDPLDFQLSSEEIRSKYPEISIYEKKFRGLGQNTPLASSVIDVWGEPDHKKSHWRYFLHLGIVVGIAGAVNGVDGGLAFGAGLTYIIRPVPPKTYAWKKGKYCIEANIDTTFPDFRQRIVHWKWSELHDAGATYMCSKGRPLAEGAQAASY